MAVNFEEDRVDGDNGPHDYELIRTWSAVDSCGNPVSEQQIVTVQDTEGPTLSEVPEDTSLECHLAPATPRITAHDDCDMAQVVTLSEVEKPGTCTHGNFLERIWTAQDDTGNVVSHEQVVQFHDTTSPVLYGLPAEAETTVECDSIPEPADVTVQDNCDDDVVVEFDEVEGYGGDITRTWRAVDDCGNEVEFVQTLTVVDTTNPLLVSVPPSVHTSCDMLPTPPTVTADDNCEESLVVQASDVREDGSCPNEYLIIRTWSVTDGSDNTASQSQTVTVTDIDAPVLSGTPGDTTVDCDDIPAPPTVVANDMCDTGLIVTYTETVEPHTNTNEYRIFRDWVATDQCGNSGSHSQTIHVVDEAAPVISPIPTDTTVEYPAIPLTYDGQYTATDTCDEDVPVEFSEVITGGTCEYHYTIIRTWTATDDNDNMVSTSQTIVVQDTTPPVLHNVPTDIPVESTDVPALDLTEVYATDASSDDLVVRVSEVKIPGACENQYILERTFYVEDACGNGDYHIQVITVQDNTAPVFNEYPDNEEVECDSIPRPCDVEVEGEDLDVAYAQTIYGTVDTGEYTIHRTWTATDCAGHTTMHRQTITVVDTTEPVMSRYPEDENVPCDCDTFPAPPHIFALDNCFDNVQVNYEEIRQNGNSWNDYTLLRTWTASDYADNTAQHTQTIIVTDSEAPTLAFTPSHSFAECDDVDDAPTNFFRDNCDSDVQSDYVETQTAGTCDNTYTLHRTWTAADDSGNDFSYTQNVNVEDTVAPTLAPSTLSCLWPADDRYFVIGNARENLLSVSDNCASDVLVTFISCNSTQTGGNTDFDEDCFYYASGDTLFVRAQRDEAVLAGRTYNLYASIEDSCGNSQVVKKPFWVPHQLDDATDINLSCNSGTVNNHP